MICCNMVNHLEEKKLSLCRQICEATGAKVVLSTDWRRIPFLKKKLIATLRAHGMQVIGATAMRAPYNPVRPEEIMEVRGRVLQRSSPFAHAGCASDH